MNPAGSEHGEDRVPRDSEDRVVERLLELPDLARGAAPGGPMARFVDAEFLVGTFRAEVRLSIRGGEVVDARAGPVLMRSHRFAYRATPEAWEAHWRPLPPPGFHDLLAMTKRGAARLEGDLQPFIANLQFYKDLLALPRGVGVRSAGGRP